MYPGLVFNIDDQSDISKISTEEKVTAPLFMQVFTADKGTEDLAIWYGKDFFKQYGDISFARHGQPLAQAANAITSGAQVLCKRVVAPDSTLANTIVNAKLASKEEQQVDAEGNPLYKTPSGEITTSANGDDGSTNEAYVKKVVSITYETTTVAGNKNDINDLKSSAYAAGTYADTELGEDATYPLFVITDIGRGVSAKKFRISPDFSASKTSDYMKYNLNVIEGTNVLETMQFAFDPSIVMNGKSISFENVVKTQSSQIKGFIFEDAIEAMINNLAEMTGTPVAELKNNDILFAHDKKGKALESIVVDGDIDLTVSIGIPLASGSNGSFGTAPMKSEDYSKEIVKVFDGTFDKSVYDVDNLKLDAIIDANYDVTVKRAIEALVTFREDTMYFRDLGLGLKTLSDIVDADLDSTRNRYCASFCNSYDVIDPYSKKQVTVTIGYSLARVLVNHFNNGCNRPLAGQLHEFIFPEIVEGTVNFLPIIIPGLDQKEALFDARINFISYFDGVPTMESEYTSQERYTAFSWINNTLAIQEVIKAIRTKCPKIRYSFMENEDLEKYQEDVNAVINKFSSNFHSIKLEYAADPVYEANNIFYAVIEVQFKKFVETELFKITAIN